MAHRPGAGRPDRARHLVRRPVPAGLALLLRPDLRGAGARAGLRAQGDQFASSLVRGLGPSRPWRCRTSSPPTSRPGRATGCPCRSPAGSPRCRSRATRRPSTSRRASGCSRSWRGRCGRSQRSVPCSSAWATGSDQPPSASSPGNLDAGSGYDPDGLRAVPELFALDEGRVVTGAHGRLRGHARPPGTATAYGLRSIARQHLRLARRRRLRRRHRARARADRGPRRRGDAPLVTGAVDLPSPLGLPRPRLGARPQRREGAGHRGRRRRGDRGRDGAGRDRPDGHQAAGLARRHPAGRGGPRPARRPRGRDPDPARRRRRGPRVHAGPRRCRCPEDGSQRIRDIGWRTPTTISVLQRRPQRLLAGAHVLGRRRRRARSSPPALTACAAASGASSPPRWTAATSSRWARASWSSLATPTASCPRCPRASTSLTYVG